MRGKPIPTKKEAYQQRKALLQALSVLKSYGLFSPPTNKTQSFF